jgi:ABC-type antimicrobial peptide transport system ATPase subunit
MTPRRYKLLTIVGGTMVVAGIALSGIGVLAIAKAIHPIALESWQVTVSVVGFLMAGLVLLALRSRRARVIALSFFAPMIWADRSRRHHRWFCMNRRPCHVCGYDLRASKDRCPECGAAIVDKAEG